MDNANLLVMLPQRMFAASDNFSLMAIPLFVLAGELMGFGGITEALADMSRSVIGHIRGGLAYVTVVVGVFLGGAPGFRQRGGGAPRQSHVSGDAKRRL